MTLKCTPYPRTIVVAALFFFFLFSVCPLNSAPFCVMDPLSVPVKHQTISKCFFFFLVDFDYLKSAFDIYNIIHMSCIFISSDCQCRQSTWMMSDIISSFLLRYMENRTESRQPRETLFKCSSQKHFIGKKKFYFPRTAQDNKWKYPFVVSLRYHHQKFHFLMDFSFGVAGRIASKENISQ